MENKKKLSVASIIVIILAIIGVVAIIFGIVQAFMLNITPLKKAKMEAEATVPYGQYSFKEAHFNPNIADFSVLKGAMKNVVYEIREDLFAIYDLDNGKKFEVKNPKYEKRIMKDESQTQTDGLRIYFDGGSIMPAEDTIIGIEYTVYDLSNYAAYRIYTFDKVVWISHYLALGEKESLRYVYELEKNKEEVTITDDEKSLLNPMEDEVSDIEFEDLGEVSTEPQEETEE